MSEQLQAFDDLIAAAASLDNKLHAGLTVAELSTEQSRLYNAINSAKTVRPVIVKAVNSHDALVNALTLALPYVESALEDQGYKPGVVDRMTKTIRAALKLAETEGV